MPLDIQQALTSFAMLGATWVLWLLLVLSVIGMTVVFERTYFFWRTRELASDLGQRFQKLVAGGDMEGASELLGASHSFEAQIAQAGVDSAKDGHEAAAERMAGQAQLAKLAMEKNVAFLGTVGNNAPFVGLLGTVIGIIRAFAALDASGGQVSDRLMTEVGEALVATSIGILVALPAVAFFNVFQRITRARIGRANAMGKELLASLHAKRAPVEAKAAQ